MSEIGRTPSSPIKRQLRQEAGFGCCFCGHPFIQYHHIVEWAGEHHNRPEDMMTVCGQCHPLCTTGAIRETEQRQAKARPKNIVDGELRGKLWVNANALTVHVAGGVAVNTPRLLTLGDTEVLGARLDREFGRVLLTAQVHDQSGRQIATLQNNEWSMDPTEVWDFEAYPLHAIIRTQLGAIAFNVDVRGDVVRVEGKWFYNGKRINFTPAEARIGTNLIRGMNATNCAGLIAVG